MSKWHTSTLLDIVELIGGGTPKTSVESYWNGDIPWLSVKDFNNDKRYVYSTEKHISQEGLENSSAKLLQKDDIIISARGTVGELAMIPSPMAFNQSCYGVRGKRGIDQTFLYYLIKNSIRQLKAMTHGSVFDTITRDTFSNIFVSLPDIKTQRAIALLLSNLDDKIEENELINQNLEEQAQALYKAWFLDFEPFKGIVPADWKPVTLGDVAAIKTDTFSPARNPDVLVEHYSIPAYDESRYPIFESASEIKSNKYILTPMSVMISKLNPDTKRIWRPMCITDASVSSTEFIVYESYNPAYKDFLYSVLDSIPFFHYLCAHTTGSTNSRQRATPKATLDFPLLLPPDSVIKRFCNIVSPMYDLISANIIENQSLSHTRNCILPKLMSGELDVSSLNI